MASYIKKVRKDSNANLAQEATITYNLPGQKTQTYTIRGSHIYNSAGKEVFTEESKHRNRIFANLAVQQGRAVVVEHKGRKYVVNNKDAIISVATGDKMNWSENNGDRKAIVELAKAKFNSMRSNNPAQPIQTTTNQNTSTVTKIISGGQTGVDTIGLQVAKSLGIETGGTAPKGFLREKGIDNEDISSYGLIEISDEQQADYTNRKGKRDPYTGRTELNVRNSDGTVYFSTDSDYAGKTATKRAADEFHKPFIENPTAEELRDWIDKNGIKTLNVAGSRGSKLNNGAEIAKIIKEALTFSKEVDSTTNDLTEKTKSSDVEEAERNKKLNIEDVIDDNIPLSIEDIDMVDTIFEPKTRRQRISLIASLFSFEVDKALENHRNQLNALIDKATREGNVDELNQYKAQLEELSREKIIDTLTPGQIFKNIYKTFAGFVNDTEEHRVEAELIQLNLRDRNNRYSKDYKKALAKKKATHKLQEFKKMIDNPMVFKALCEDSSRMLLITEGLQIDINRDYVEKLNLIEEDPEGRSFIDEETGESKIEEAVKDGWMTNYKHISSKDSLSQEVRAVIRTIPQLNYKGKYDLDDLGIQKYLDANYVHATLIDALRYMVTSNDMIPALKKLAKQKPWVKQIIKKLEESKAGDSVLFS